MFCITSYNILSHLAYTDWQKSVYKNEFDMRYNQIYKELVEMNSDIFCLQEVTTVFSKHLEKFIAENEYKMVINKRGDDCSQPILYKSNKFELMSECYWIIEETTKEFALTTKCLREGCLPAVLNYVHRPADYAVQVVSLKNKMDGRTVFIFNLHNIWEDQEKDDAKALHMAAIMWKASSLLRGHEGLPVFFCGDFNSYPTSPLYTLMDTGRVSTSCLKDSVSMPVDMSNSACGLAASERKEVYLYELLSHDFELSHGMNLQSAHKAMKGCEPEITSWDSVQRYTGCYDYIFFTPDHVKCIDVKIEIVDRDAAFNMERAFLETKWSDHLPVTGVFHLN